MSALPNPICYICQKEITSENDTREHIIPDSIGGKLKGKGILDLLRRCISNLAENYAVLHTLPAGDRTVSGYAFVADPIKSETV